MAELTKLDTKIAEVLGLAMASQRATKQVASMLGDDEQDLAPRLERMHAEAKETEERCTELAGSFDGKKTAILDKAREVRDEGTEMMETYLAGEDEALDGFEFLTMAEAGEVGHWRIVETLNRKAGDAGVAAVVEWALPIQQRHFDEVLQSALQIAASEDPEEVEG